MNEEQNKRLLDLLEKSIQVMNSLGTNNSDTDMGGLELIAKELNEFTVGISKDTGDVLMHCAHDIRKGLESIAEAIEK